MFSLYCALTLAFSRVDDLHQLSRNDKVKHCTLSCEMRVSCGRVSSYMVGYAKELLDFVNPGGSAPLNFSESRGDMTANYTGLILARGLKQRSECFQLCADAYYEQHSSP